MVKCKAFTKKGKPCKKNIYTHIFCNIHMRKYMDTKRKVANICKYLEDVYI
jgi:hypothetical protein